MKFNLSRINIFKKENKNPSIKIIWVLKLSNFKPCKVTSIFQIDIKLSKKNEEIIE